MDWVTFGSSIGGTAILIGVASFLGRKWLGTRIEESVKHEYAKELEAHKARLQEQINYSISQKESELKEIEKQKETDKVLFEKFLQILPSSGSIAILKSQIGIWDWRSGALDQIWKFYENWGNPEQHFLDEKIEEKRNKLYSYVDTFLKYQTLKTYPSGNSDQFQSVPKEWAYGSDAQRKLFDETMLELDRLAENVILAHEDLIQTARGLLKC